MQPAAIDAHRTATRRSLTWRRSHRPSSSDLVIGRIRGHAARVESARQQTIAVTPLHHIVPRATRISELPVAPVVRKLDAKHRFQIAGLCDMLAWEPGELAFARDGAWLVLTRDVPRSSARRHVVRVASDDRVTVSAAARSARGRARHLRGVGRRTRGPTLQAHSSDRDRSLSRDRNACSTTI